MSDWESILAQVNKPGRYLGNEINAIHKDLSEVKTKVALIFPDLYELGMSHLGLKILYHLLNQQPDIAAERAYTPGLDLEEILRREQVPLPSLESKLPLKEFDILGFTLPYEMGYTNVLTVLDLAQIPLLAKDRDENWPLVIGGGTCAANPEPMAQFFDAFVLGDGEEVVLELAYAYQACKEKKTGRQELLERLSEIRGVYVPSFFEVSYKSDGVIAEIKPLKKDYQKVQRCIVSDLDKAFYPVEGITPHLDVVHDRITMEIARGCTQGCRFCNAGMTYRPRRQRSPEVIASLIERSLNATGYEEVSLASLSSGDYTQLPQLIQKLAHYPEHKIAVSLPSLRPGTLAPSMVEYIKQVRQTGFTIAPEAGTERLRCVINKGISEEDVLQTVKLIFANGWQGIKLYFMIGLPTEEEADLEGIAQLVRRVQGVAKRSSSLHDVKISLSISAFVPKAHTPFQWVAQDSVTEFEAKQNYIRSKLSRKRYKMKWHNSVLSLLEGVMSRGDRRLGDVILRAWANGARFDQWSEHFNYSHWEEAFSFCRLVPEFYAQRQRELDEVLPWQHLDTGISSEFLKSEYHKALRAEPTPNCSKVGCHDCGLAWECSVINETESGFSDKSKVESKAIRYKDTKLLRLRARFSKLKEMRFLSHLDLVRLFSRALRRAQLPVSYSQGYHPHPRIAFSPPLSVGLESEAEYIDVELFDYVSPNEFADRLNQQLPPSIQVSEARQVPLKVLALTQQEHLAAYSIWVPRQIWGNGCLSTNAKQDQQQRLKDFLEQEEILISRKFKNKIVDAKPLISDFKLADLDENGLSLKLILKSSPQGNVKPQEIVRNLYQMSELSASMLQVKRLALWLKKGQHFITPLAAGV